MRVVARAPARRGAALLHRVEGAQHQAAPARARPRLDAERVRAVRARGRQGHRQRDRGSRSTRALGLPFIPPVLREDAGEIEAAENGHAAAADRPAVSATSTCTRRCRATGARRWRRWSRRRSRAATASWPSPITPRGRCRAWAATRSLEQRARIRALQAELGDSLTLLHGVELNIGPTGELDYDLEFRRAFDWCLASVHDHFDLDRAAQTRRIVDRHAGPGGAHDRPPRRRA